MPLDIQAAEKELQRVPWWGWAGIGGVALGLGILIRKRHSAASVAPITMDANTGLPDGLEPFDLAGLPFGADATGAFEPSDPGAPSQVGVGDPGLSPTNTPVSALPPNNGGPDANPTRLPPNRINPPAPSPVPANPQASPHASVPVGHWPNWDGSLSGIASHYGKSLQAVEAYDGNRATVYAHAHAHGHYGDEWNWLFPGEGEVIEVPL